MKRSCCCSSEEHVLFNPSLEIGDRVASGGDVMPGDGDPEIRLFGLEIPLQDCQGVAEPTGAGERSSMGKRDEMVKSLQAKNSEDEVLATEQLDRSKRSNSSGLNNCDDDAHRITTSDAGTSEQKYEQDNPEATLGQDKVLKKPDKILPCPRCNSLATKFCYYNNYNVNQPRHFCKKCQRYWTAGGSLRNLPVGSGKRKNKSFASHHCHVVIPSDGLADNRTDSPNPVIYPVQPVSFSGHLPVKDLKTNSTAFKFESEGPLSESMSSVLNLGDKNNATMATLHCHDKNEAGSCSSSTTISNCVENDNLEVALDMEKNSIHASSNSVTLPYNLLCFPAPPWPYTWPVGWNNMASMMSGYCSSELVYSQTNGSPNPVPWPPQALASPMHSPSTPFLYPATNWGHIPSWPKAMWNLPSAYMSEHGYSISNSPTLGKHSRDAISEAEDKTEKILWVPKTLRIDDPDEAAKSSIWATLGITPGKSSKRGAIFETLRSNSERNQTPDATRVLQANPAAIARSQKLQESA